MKFPGIDLSNFMSGSSFNTEENMALANAVGIADRMNTRTFGNMFRNDLMNESYARRADASLANQQAVQGIMAPAETFANFADAGSALMSFDYGSLGGGGYAGTGSSGLNNGGKYGMAFDPSSVEAAMRKHASGHQILY